MIISDNFIFKVGKHTGKSYKFVKEKDPSYITWALENAPNLLKESKPKIIKSEDAPQPKKIVSSKLEPNTDFLKQKSE